MKTVAILGFLFLAQGQPTNQLPRACPSAFLLVKLKGALLPDALGLTFASQERREDGSFRLGFLSPHDAEEALLKVIRDSQQEIESVICER